MEGSWSEKRSLDRKFVDVTYLRDVNQTHLQDQQDIAVGVPPRIPNHQAKALTDCCFGGLGGREGKNSELNNFHFAHVCVPISYLSGWNLSGIVAIPFSFNFAFYLTLPETNSDFTPEKWMAKGKLII